PVLDQAKLAVPAQDLHGCAAPRPGQCPAASCWQARPKAAAEPYRTVTRAVPAFAVEVTCLIAPVGVNTSVKELSVPSLAATGPNPSHSASGVNLPPMCSAHGA